MKLLALPLIVLLVCVIACSKLGKTAPTIIPIDDFTGEFKKSPDAFKAKYLNKEVIVMGKVRGTFDGDYTYNSVGHESLYIVDSHDDLLQGVDCEVTEANAAKFKGVTTGD